MSIKLLPTMKHHRQDARVVLVTSTTHTSGEFNLKNMQGKTNYNKAKWFANSQLYQVTYIEKMKIHTNHIHSASSIPSFRNKSEFHHFVRTYLSVISFVYMSVFTVVLKTLFNLWRSDPLCICLYLGLNQIWIHTSCNIVIFLILGSFQ